MVRLVIFALVVLALGYGFSWLADRPGDRSLVWEGQLYQTRLVVAASALIALIAAVMAAWWLLRTLWTSPYSVTRYFRARKRDRGYQALSTGLIAAGAGNALMARKMAARSQGLLRADQEPLIALLEAQAALIEGRHDEARLVRPEWRAGSSVSAAGDASVPRWDCRRAFHRDSGDGSWLRETGSLGRSL